MTKTSTKRKPSAPPRSARIKAVDSLWIKQTLDRLGFTQRFVADKLGCDYPVFPRAVNGQRAWTVQEAVDFAVLTHTPLAEFLPRIGIEIPDNGDSLASTRPPVPIKWQATNGAQVEPASGAVTASASAPTAVAALRLHDMPGVGQAVMYLDNPRPAAECVGRLCLLEIKGSRLLASVSRGLDDATYSIREFGGASPAADVPLREATPVLWARF